MNKFKIEITVNGRYYDDYLESELTGKELMKSIQNNKFFYIEKPDNITTYNVSNIDRIRIIQE